MESYDAIVVGAGQAGPTLATRLAAAGQRVLLIERNRLGGTCVNTGCTPTKTLIASARVAHVARDAARFGVRLAGAPQIDMAQVRDRARAVSANSRARLETWLRGTEGLDLVCGHARFTGPGRLSVNGREITAPRIFLNVGARPARPDLPGIDRVPSLSSSTILDLEEVPRHLGIVGGSYIGLEFAQMYRRLGAEVTIVERAERLIAREAPEVSDAIRDILEAEGIAVRTAADCIALDQGADGPMIRVSCAEGAPEVACSHVLIAVGRTPNTDDLGLETAGITTDARGYIPVNDRLETGEEGVWALGDCNGRGAFTHTAWDDHEIVAANLLGGENRSLADRVPAYALFIDPPLGRVGLTETQARAAGLDVTVATRPMTRVARAVERDETRGLMKVVAEAGSGRLLGAAILGVGGDEVVHGLLDLMSLGATAAQMRRTMPIHPTVSELLPTLLAELA